jgi:hypothetical protein
VDGFLDPACAQSHAQTSMNLQFAYLTCACE